MATETIDTGEPGLETRSRDPNSFVTTVTGSYPARHANAMATIKVVVDDVAFSSFPF